MTKKQALIGKICLILLFCALAALCAGMLSSRVRADEGEVTGIKIEIDFGDYDGRNDGKNLPHGKKGMSYPVFACTATDNLGNDAESVLVTVANDSGKLIPQTNGRFATETAGKYTVKYDAVSGSVSATRTLTITVDEYVDNISYDNGGENVPTTGTTGSAVFVRFGDFGGGTGELEPFMRLTRADDELEMQTAAFAAYFVPEKSGEYTVTYGVTDFVGDEKSVVKTVTITDPDVPVMNAVSLPGSAIEGETLELPLPDAIFYRNGNKTYVPVRVTFDGDDVTADMKVAGLATGNHKIEYVAANPLDESKQVKQTFDFTVKSKSVAANAKIFDNYFEFTNCAADSENKSEYVVKVTANADRRPLDAAVAFSRALPVEYANLELKMTAAFAAYDDAYFVVTDSKNASEQIKIRISRLSSQGAVWLSYDEATQSIINRDGGATLTKIDSYSDKTKFNGFGSGRVYVSFELKGVVKDVALSLTKVGSSAVTTGSTDFTPPSFVTNPDYRSVYVTNIGHKVYLPEMRAFDLLDKNVAVTLTVRKPDGTLLFEGQGGYELDVTESGEYGVEYTARDASSNIRKLVSGVSVVDLESPVIKVSGVKATVKVGDEITLPKAEITDNDTAADKILGYVYVLSGNNRKELVGETYKFETAGEYKIRYVAYDANQNYTVVEFTVICK